MPYQFEALTDGRFQQLCQAVLASIYPSIQCLPVDQPDGGRDAFVRRRYKDKPKDFIAFQVKFAKEPKTKDARDFITQVIKTEKPKVDRLVARGASKYYLLTNVLGTSHLDSGSIDKVNEELRTAFNIDAFCWWRDDLARRIDSRPAIKWSYPEIIRASDLLQMLLEKAADPDAQRRVETIRAYMAYQYRYDSQLKFKQIDLEKRIEDLFVDVPAAVAGPISGRRRSRNATLEPGQFDLEYLEYLGSRERMEGDEDTLAMVPGALFLLSRAGFAKDFSRIVIEGAPGQGKSTVTQYLCQIHRAVLLGKLSDYDKIDPDHKPTEARIPFRVDLRDYASWLAGRDPFGDDSSSRLAPTASPVLESFLAAQVHRYTGKVYSVDDLTATASSSQLLVVLDGFDEVADIPLRNRLVAEVTDAAARIEANALSAQFLVTSRPAAFANSPGFPRDEWQHLKILSLSRSAIENYANKWLVAWGAEERERRDTLRVLREKLNLPHVRDLARNPMQLAILLALITIQGGSLPDKRTALYDRYIEIFLNRESEKSSFVRDHRELLIQIHRFVAWKLHVDAESAQGTGNIAEPKLRDMLQEFLAQEGHPTNLISELFAGMVERVVVLVSRVQGTFEFEVQPLREYFAARFLYDTAPYSPSGAQKPGTLPERFDAIARNFYWLNVTRFYAGCYSTGELASLLDGLDQLGESTQFRYISHVSELAVTLLTDYVFSQQPKLAEKLAIKFTDGQGFRILLASRHGEGQTIVLPPGTARDRLVSVCKAALSQGLAMDTAVVIARTLAANLPKEKLHEVWRDVRSRFLSSQRWLSVGAAMGVYQRMTVAECSALITELGKEAVVQIALFGKNDVFLANPELWRLVIEGILDINAGRSLFYYSRRREAGPNEWELFVAQIAAILEPTFYMTIEDAIDKWTLRMLATRMWSNYRSSEPPELSGKLKAIPEAESFWEACNSFLDSELVELKEDQGRWNDLFNAGEKAWGRRWAFCRLAIGAVVIGDFSPDQKCCLTDWRLPLVTRVVAARSAGSDRDWWSAEIERAEKMDPITLRFVLVNLFAWVPLKSIIILSDVLSNVLDKLSRDEWTELASAVEELEDWGKHRANRVGLPRESVPAAAISEGKMSPRLISLITSRMNAKCRQWVVRRHLMGYRGDDEAVLKTCLRIVAEQVGHKSFRWEDALPLICHAYRCGVAIPILHRERSSAPVRELSVHDATRICEKPDAYPLYLVKHAVAVLTERTGADAIPVGKIAARDAWFAEQ